MKKFSSKSFQLGILFTLAACQNPGRGGPVVDASQPANDLSSAQMDMMMINGLDVEPDQPGPLSFTFGMTPLPTMGFSATLLGVPVAVHWTVDRGDLGTVTVGPSEQTVFTPTGSRGGVVSIIATYNSTIAKRQLLVQLTAGPQNGVNTSSSGEQGQLAPDASAATFGNPLLGTAGGGIGGVGGEGLGPTVTDVATKTALTSPTGDGSAQHLAFLYPYDKTLWPRGMLAPLIMWNWDTGDADAIRIDLSTTTGSFSWTGIFSRPTILGSGKFIRHPIPQDIWDIATNSAGGATTDGSSERIVIKLTVAKDGQAYGPVSETWRVAPARLTGTIYYNAYGTQFVTNWLNDTAGHKLGGAILGIRSGDSGPHVVAGFNSTADDSGCRACHVVASHGRWMITQREDGSQRRDNKSYLYDLAPPPMNTDPAATPTGAPLCAGDNGTGACQWDGFFEWTGMVGDGSFTLTNTLQGDTVSGIAEINYASGTASSAFYAFQPSPTGPSPISQTLSGLPSGVSAGYPTFSPDDKFVAYIDVTSHQDVANGPLTVARYDSSSQIFSGPAALVSPSSGQQLGFPAFLPDNSGVVFETQTRAGKSGGVTEQVLVTMGGARGELWWVNSNGTPTAAPLSNLNGKNGSASYLPIGNNNHGIAGATDSGSTYSESGLDDTTLNYEPTVAPVVTGGYAWVVFTSRRLYGNQLTSVPWKSDPSTYDSHDLANEPTKKLWVAAIDLHAPAGTDPSFPAFYLPAQELLSSNSRGYWVLDPCHADGASCDSGDQCCGGCCQPNGTGGALVCESLGADQTGCSAGNCSQANEKCTTTADCCDSSSSCVAGFCAPGVIN